MPMSTTGRRAHRGPRRGLRLCRRRPDAWPWPGSCAAVVLPVVIPHFPTRYLIDGLGRSSEATGFSDGQVGLKSTLDLDQEPQEPVQGAGPQLHDQRRDPHPAAGRGARHLPRRQLAARAGRRRLRPAQHRARCRASSTTTCRARPTGSSVEDSRIEAPQIAAPDPAGDRRPGPGQLGPGPQHLGRHGQPVGAVLQLHLPRPQPDPGSRWPSPGRGRPVGSCARTCRSTPTRRTSSARRSSEVVPQDATRIEAARAIQKYLRTDGGFTLLPRPARDGEERVRAGRGAPTRSPSSCAARSATACSSPRPW